MFFILDIGGLNNYDNGVHAVRIAASSKKRRVLGYKGELMRIRQVNYLANDQSLDRPF